MWVERYRPQRLSDVVNQREIIGSIEALLKKESEMPHMLFSGSAGIGKTTTALCVARQILGDNWREYMLELNASDERGINMVREKVKKFSRWAGFGDIPFKIIILDEADEMTSDAQTALRRIIEDTARHCRFIITANNISKIIEPIQSRCLDEADEMTSDAQTALRRIIEDTARHCRFIITANNISKIIEPIQSRCAVFKFTAVSRQDVVSRLKAIAEKEGTESDEDGLQAVYDYAGGDLRHAINLLQTVASMGGITEDRVKAAAGLTKSEDVKVVLKLALGGKFPQAREKMIGLVKVYGMSESDFLKYLCAAVFGGRTDHAGDILEIIAKYDYRILAGSNPEIQLSALLAELARVPR
jgi:replication factor C small subunit